MACPCMISAVCPVHGLAAGMERIVAIAENIDKKEAISKMLSTIVVLHETQASLEEIDIEISKARKLLGDSNGS